LPSKAHGSHKGLRVLHLDLKAERRQESSREKLHPLGLLDASGAGQQHLEPILVVLHRPRATTGRQLEEGCRAERGAVAQIEKFLEMWPGPCAFVLLDLHVPELRPLLKIVRRHPHALLRHDALLQEEGFTFVDEDERISIAVVARELRTSVFRRPVLMVLVGAWLPS
jgi:hypothetical protein